MDMSLCKLRELVIDREPHALHSVGLQGVGYDCVTELNCTIEDGISSSSFHSSWYGLLTCLLVLAGCRVYFIAA